MALDSQAVAISIGAIASAVAAIATGMITGRSTRRKDQFVAQVQLEQSRFAREKAESDASKVRIEAIALDNTDLRLRLRAIESEYEAQLLELRSYARVGWDAANFHFNLLSVVSHQLNNIFQIAAIGGDLEAIAAIVAKSELRMKAIRIPTAVDDTKTTEKDAPP